MSLANPAPRVFPDSNVLVEGLFSPWSVSRAILIMARAKLFSLVLSPYVEKEVERALLALADLDLHAIHGQPLFLADVVVDAGTGAVGRADRLFRHERHLDKVDGRKGAGARPQRKLAPRRNLMQRVFRGA